MISLSVFWAEAMAKQATTAERLIKAGGVHMKQSGLTMAQALVRFLIISTSTQTAAKSNL